MGAKFCHLSDNFCVLVEEEHVYFHPVGSKEPSILKLLTSGPAKYFHKMAANAKPSCHEESIKILKTRIITFFLELITK